LAPRPHCCRQKKALAGNEGAAGAPNLIVVDGKVALAFDGFSLTGCAPEITVDGKISEVRLIDYAMQGSEGTLYWRSSDLELRQILFFEEHSRVRVVSRLKNVSSNERTLNHVKIFSAEAVNGGACPAEMRILEQSFYNARIRTLGPMATASDRLLALDGLSAKAFVSDTVTVLYDRAAGRGLLIGFETFDRWRARIVGHAETIEPIAGSETGKTDSRIKAPERESAQGSVGKGCRITYFAQEFAGGDLPIPAGSQVLMPELVFEVGKNPDGLLAAYADRVAKRHAFPAPTAPFANWCSWYAFRLEVSHEKILAQATQANERSLGKLGLRFLQADLGWQLDNIPTYFETNERFSRGLQGVSQDLRKAGFQLGAWCGAICVAATHPIARAHPEWLLRRKPGDHQPAGIGNWYWDPKPETYVLDVTHPGAREWLLTGIKEMARSGVRYFKWDFAGKLTDPVLGGRSNPVLVTNGLEALRGITREIQLALNQTAGEEVLMLDCGGVDMGGAGITRLSYATMDSGNTGFLGPQHTREIYTTFACHLFKQRWALLQPSCLVVGLPGTIDEARLRATATFLGAGHVDLGDDLVTLPEERWKIILATLPPNQTPARIVDLWEPIRTGTVPAIDSETGLGGEHLFVAPTEEIEEGASIWCLPVQADWDSWTLVGVFNWTDAFLKNETFVARRYQVDFSRLGLAADARLWAYEFWSGQFLGVLPQAKLEAEGYSHRGDLERLMIDSGPGLLDLAFHGPCVKLLVLRPARPHPWPVGTSFHQSGGRELSEVKWNEHTRTLEGKLLRPKGESGYLVIANPFAGPSEAGIRRMPITASGDVTSWRAVF